ncbi:MAG: Hsp20/alpha crystallin family protein [Cyanobacteria bacterium SZAS-4]|nr:Hsp20/alpha crystallin family protein [Cyanobacteria bacterium SZAS-4]
MKVTEEKFKKAAIVALSLAVGFISGFAIKDLCDKNNSAHASEAATVPVQKLHDPQLGKVNRLIAPHLWDVYVDPLFMPVNLTLRPLPLLPLMDFTSSVPKLQTIDGDNELRVIAQVPGMDEKDVKVEASEHAVIIKAHKNQEEKSNSRFETFSESFEQSVHLPCKVNADKVQASVKNGVLTVTLPKS